MDELFVISRQANDTVNGVRRTGRVYITGPHFGIDVFSSTEDPAEAGRFDREEAERLVATKWRGSAPAIEPAPKWS